MATIGWLSEQWLHNIDSNVSSNGNVRIDSINHNGTNLRITGIMAITMRGPSSSYYGYYVYGAYGTPKSGGEQKILENNQKVYSGNYASKSFDVTIPNVAASATSAEFTCRFRDGKSQYFDKTLKWTINFDASGTAPTITGLSVTSRTYNSFTANTTVSNWGSGGDRTFRVLKVLKEQYSAGKDALGKQSYNSSTSAVSLTVSRAGADDIVGTAFDIKGASKYYLGIYADNGTKDSRFADTNQYATPPAPLASVTKTSSSASSTANSITHTISITGGSTSVNSTNAVTTQYRYSTNGGSSYTDWASISGTAAPQTAKTFTFTSAYGASCAVQARQVYESQYSEVKSLTFTATAATAPTISSVVLDSYGKDWAKVKTTVSSYGTPSSVANRYVEGAVLGQNSYGASYRWGNSKAVTSATITVNNSSSANPSTFTIKPNTTYYYGGYATNTVKTISKVQGSFTTLPPDLNSLTAGTPVQSGNTFTVTLSYAYTKAGSAYTEYFKYKVNSGAEASVTAATSGTVTLSNLAPETSYTVVGRLGTTAGNGTSRTVTFTTPAAYKAYGSVNGSSKRVKKIYGSVNGKAVLIKKVYASVNGKAKRVF